MTAHALAIRVGRPLGVGARAAWWLFLAGLSGLVIYNTLPFFTLASDLPFLLEKAAQYQDVVWRVSFYVHISGGILCLAAALPQFSRTLLKRAPRVHRAFGWTYVLSVLVLVAPAGLYMAIFAKGGMPGRVGFLVLGVALFYTTWRGLERVRARDFKGHVAWMIRSYAMAASAVSFRVFYIGLFLAGVEGEYVIAIWLSFGANLALGEWVVRRHRKGVRR